MPGRGEGSPSDVVESPSGSTIQSEVKASGDPPAARLILRPCPRPIPASAEAAATSSSSPTPGARPSRSAAARAGSRSSPATHACPWSAAGATSPARIAALADRLGRLGAGHLALAVLRGWRRAPRIGDDLEVGHRVVGGRGAVVRGQRDHQAVEAGREALVEDLRLGRRRVDTGRAACAPPARRWGPSTAGSRRSGRSGGRCRSGC